jgi:hypothetical protein
LSHLRQWPVGPNTYQLPVSRHGLRQRHEAGASSASIQAADRFAAIIQSVAVAITAGTLAVAAE